MRFVVLEESDLLPIKAETFPLSLGRAFSSSVQKHSQSEARPRNGVAGEKISRIIGILRYV
jgi:hypothetical protein